MTEHLTLAGLETLAAGEGSPVLLLHPSGGSVDDWDELMPLLAMHARVLAPSGVTSADDARAVLDADAQGGHGTQDDAGITVVIARGDAAHVAYALALEGRATALVLVAAEPPDASLVEPLQSLDIPAFLVWGEDDEVVPVAVGEALTDVLLGATLAVVPESGNDVLRADAPTILPLMKEYLKVRVLGVGGHSHANEPVLMDVSFTRPPQHADQPTIDD